ncbi:MAG: IS4 family transposase, partial [Thermoplasmatota archaeon]
ALDMVKTKKPAIVLGLVWTAILTLIVSRRLHNLMLRSVPRELAHRYPPLLWSTVFMENGDRLLGALMRNLRFEPKVEGDLVRLAWIYEGEALDPHVNRRRLREVHGA